MEPLVERVPAQESALLRLYLADRDVPCPQCNYNLRNLTGNVCPECGEEIALRVYFVEPRQAAPLAGLITLSAGAGLNGLLLIYWMFVIWRFGQRSNRIADKFFLVNFFGALALGICMVIWLRCWGYIRRSQGRWWLFGASVVLTLLDLVIFIVIIR